MGKLTIRQLLSRKMFKDIKESDLSESQINNLNKILDVYDSKSIKNRLTNIFNFIKFDVDGDWLERIDIIRNKLKNDTVSFYSIEVRYGEQNANKIYEENCKKFGRNKTDYIKKYGEVLGEIKWNELKIKSKTPWGLAACIERFGEEEGKKKWDERLTKKNNTMLERKKNKPYRNGRTLKEYQTRYGIDKGFKLWSLRNNRQKYRFSEQYFIDTFGKEEGKIEYEKYKKTMIKTTLSSFIDRYGEIVGTIRFNEYVKKIKYSSSLDYFISKYGEELGKVKYDELLKKKIYCFPRYSKISQTLFWTIYEKLAEVKQNKCHFAELNEEFIFFVHQDWGKIISVDFKLDNKIIEFDGDFWHSSFKQKSKDYIRDNFLISKGYEILRITENEYKKDKDNTIVKCLKFIKNEK